MIYIVSSRYRFAEYWCQERNMNPRDKNIQIITRADQCQGIQLTDDDEFVEIGSADDPLGQGASLYREWNFVKYIYNQTKKTEQPQTSEETS